MKTITIKITFQGIEESKIFDAEISAIDSDKVIGELMNAEVYTFNNNLCDDAIAVGTKIQLLAMKIGQRLHRVCKYSPGPEMTFGEGNCLKEATYYIE